MADLTPEQLDGLARLAAVRDGIEKRMIECIDSLDLNSEYTGDHFAMDSEMLRAVSLEFMDSATALVEAARKLERITSSMEEMAVDFDELVEAARERDQLIGERFAMRGEIEELRTLVANLTRRNP